jgi:8-oxo-dGTP pyrophosphatase MutT (NUDIX family)
MSKKKEAHKTNQKTIENDLDYKPTNASMQPDGIHYEQAAVIPYRWVGSRLHIYLISTLRRKHWIVPKGLVEDGLSQIETVVLETFEEAGLIGVVSDVPVGHHQTSKWEGICDITVYPMKVLVEVEYWPEHDMRKRIMVDYQEGSWRTLVTDASLVAVLEQFGTVIDFHTPEAVTPDSQTNKIAGDPHSTDSHTEEK